MLADMARPWLLLRGWLLGVATVAIVLTLVSAPWWGREVKVTARQGDAGRGSQLYATLPCASCHDITQPLPGGAVCPNLGNIATEAARIVRAPDYHGHARDAAGYIRESIVDPNAYLVPGESYRQADGQSVMPKDFGGTLTPDQLNDLVAFLLTLR
jgi:nitric oxide reductase subunit C